jgi:hypothetical protein
LLLLPPPPPPASVLCFLAVRQYTFPYGIDRPEGKSETHTSDSSSCVGRRIGNGSANYYIATVLQVKEAKLSSSTLWRYLGGVEVYFQPFLTLALDGGGLSTSRHGYFNPEKKKPGTDWPGGWVVLEKKIFLPLQEFRTLVRSACSLVTIPTALPRLRSATLVS